MSGLTTLTPDKGVHQMAINSYDPQNHPFNRRPAHGSAHTAAQAYWQERQDSKRDGDAFASSLPLNASDAELAEEQLEWLDERLGKGQGAVRERARLNRLIPAKV